MRDVKGVWYCNVNRERNTKLTRLTSKKSLGEVLKSPFHDLGSAIIKVTRPL
jgi:hypothetical protein